ncbi:(p)ppGpp synthetase [Brevibacterium sp. NPDC049920]|uniref:GTP pyrophosphokinase n=1 Tax=Brevibacterium sp. NPDC049920 TaxID=3155279 RepID=UPI0025CD01F4|nr:(p)ppGpp synthetase [uncultured Brevibacterium sp.]
MGKVEQLVAGLFRERMPDWEDARNQVKNWLARQCNEALAGLDDRTRLKVSESRIKDQDRALRKLIRKAESEQLEISSAGQVEQNLLDLVGIKLICHSTRDQELIWDHLHGLSEDAAFRICESKDYVSKPKRSGYRAKHIIVEVPVKGVSPVYVEVQIKTRLQDAWGELTHEMSYKPGEALKKTPFHDNVTNTMANLLAEVDRLADFVADDIEHTVDVDVTKADVEESADDATIDVTVTRTGPRYALADDGDGNRGLIQAIRVKELVGSKEQISVADYVEIGDNLRVRVVESEDRRIFIPNALAR